MRGVIALARRVPRAGWGCALAAFVNCLVWIVVIPPFQVPDESGHVVYAQHLAETGQIPDKENGYPFSDELQETLVALRFNDVVGRPRDRATPSRYYDSAVDAARQNPANPANGNGAIESSNQPPLYYSLAAAAYLVSPWQDLQHRLWLMRLVSALLAALTTLFTFMFLREVLKEPWTWTVGRPRGGLSAAVRVHLERGASRRAPLDGLRRPALWSCEGVSQGAHPGSGGGHRARARDGVLTKLNFGAVLPGAVLAILLLVWRAGAGRPAAVRGAAVSLAALAVAGLLFVGMNTLVWDRPASGRVVVAAAPVNADAAADPITRREQLSYAWQLYLPRLPLMNDQFDYYPLWQTFFKGTVGRFGWLDTSFPPWVYNLALVVSLALLVLLGAALWSRRAELRRRWAELLSYAAIAGGVLLSVGLLGISYRQNTGNTFEQARYLLPLLPLYGAGVALAARGIGRRLERQLGALIVVLVLAHSLFAQLLVISRYYG